MKKFIVEYTLPYEHRVQVGICAHDPDTAVADAEKLFDAGDIWDDTPDVPLLFDDYEEKGEDAESLQFIVVAEVQEWPTVDSSVSYIRRREAAFTAARLLVEAYQECQGSKIDLAYHEALKSIQGD